MRALQLFCNAVGYGAKNDWHLNESVFGCGPLLVHCEREAIAPIASDYDQHYHARVRRGLGVAKLGIVFAPAWLSGTAHDAAIR